MSHKIPYPVPPVPKRPNHFTSIAAYHRDQVLCERLATTLRNANALIDELNSHREETLFNPPRLEYTPGRNYICFANGVFIEGDFIAAGDTTFIAGHVLTEATDYEFIAGGAHFLATLPEGKNLYLLAPPVRNFTNWSTR